MISTNSSVNAKCQLLIIAYYLLISPLYAQTKEQTKSGPLLIIVMNEAVIQ